jgi:hypothetical protein
VTETEGNPDGLDYVRIRVRDIEHHLIRISSKLEWNTALTALGNHPAWRGLRERIRTLLHMEMEKFLKTRMDPYEVGRFQGTLWALRMAVQDEPLSQQEIDSVVAESSVLKNELVDCRRELE